MWEAKNFTLGSSNQTISVIGTSISNMAGVSKNETLIQYQSFNIYKYFFSCSLLSELASLVKLLHKESDEYPQVSKGTW